MKYIKIILLFLLLIPFYARGQNKKSTLQKLFVQADSIQIISHENLEVNGAAGRSNIIRKLIINNHLNNEIVKEKLILNNKARDTLFKIFTTPNTDLRRDMLSCYEPHHSVIFYKKGNCSYIDICLQCEKYNFSKDLNIDKNDLSFKKWKDLEQFFRNRNFIFEIPDKKVDILDQGKNIFN